LRYIPWLLSINLRDADDAWIKEQMHRQVLLCFQNTYVFDLSRETRSYIGWRSWRSGSASWRGGSQKVGGQVGGEPKRIDAGEEEVRRERRGKNRLRITRRAASYTNRLRATSMRHGCQLANWHRPDWPPCTADRSFLRLLRDFAFYHHTVIITIFFFFSSSSFSSRHQRPGALFFLFRFRVPFNFSDVTLSSPRRRVYDRRGVAAPVESRLFTCVPSKCGARFEPGLSTGPTVDVTGQWTRVHSE